MKLRASSQDPIIAYQRVALRALARLSAGETRPKILHRLRTHLRRLQAFFELVADQPRARKLAKRISRLSALRTWQVFGSYAKSIGASRSDLRTIRRALRAAQAKVKRKRV
jgi:hypothetical protein